MSASYAQGVGCAGGSQALRIDIVVHGRFHGFALGRALLELGHDVLVHTNYPAFAAEQFGLPRQVTRSFVCHALATRFATRFASQLSKEFLDRTLHTSFGRWAARGVRADADIIYGFSGVMEEVLRLPRTKADQMRLVVRGSAHIREQDRILREEEQRVGTALDRPSKWMIAREEREYARADRICVLSRFAHESFLHCGLASERLHLAPLGVDVGHFRASDEAIAARRERVLAGKPLHVLNVGTFSYRKGAKDLVDIAAALSDRMRFRFVGSRSSNTFELTALASEHLEMVAKLPEAVLREQYAWADLFLFPTLEDGFAVVLTQAAASGLPILSTTNCSAPDFVVRDKTGWVLPVRDVEGFISKLIWCDQNRGAVAEMFDAACRKDYARDWSSCARDLLDFHQQARKTAGEGEMR